MATTLSPTCPWPGRDRRGRLLHASIIVIGDEILGGFVRDTNSGWLASRLLHHGIRASRVHTVPDTFEAIDEAISTELERSRPRLIATSGGIGSTPDDITFEAVAATLGRDVEEHPVLARRVRRALDWTRDKGVTVDDEFAGHMLRMARIPAGGELLPGSRAFAPGIRIDLDGGIDDPAGATILVLPGVPSQFRAIVEDNEDELLAGRAEPRRVIEVTHGFPESALNRCFARILDEHPEVDLGSYPGVPMMVRLIGPPAATEAAAEQVRGYIGELLDDPAGRRLADAWAARFGGIETERR